MTPPSFSPNAFLRRRRPERFSDSVAHEVPAVDRSLLEFHLHSITSRSQETAFAEFARKLCEREICPNLLPQTGPTGGGDSKVDAETYPVADDLALAWYEGIGRKAAQERWAFAFSAKAQWRAKVQSDMKKIAGTNRGYIQAFFVTNQAVPDRQRAEVEDSLRAKYKFDIRILDRTWILDRVFTNGHEKLTVELLGVTGLSRHTITKGPNDTSREEDLAEVEQRIQAALQAGQRGAGLVNLALEAADLARNLEHPRTEIDGRYARADQLALTYGNPRQQVESAYQWAWTLFWWFEDYAAFLQKYKVVEERVRGSRNAYDLEELFTLWQCFQGSVRRNAIDSAGNAYDEHTTTLIAELERLCAEKDRPSTALQAEAFLLQMQFARLIAADESVDKVLDALHDVIVRSQGLVGFPLESLLEILTELGQFLEGSPAYDRLFETILSVTSAREGEIRGANLLLRRGEQQLLQDRSVEAIATLGRALVPLYKHETRHEIVKALYLCGCAYENIGLLWAARGTLLSAASLATNELWRYGEVTPYQAACYRRLKWIELRLGRLPHILAWHELDMVLRQALVGHGYNEEKLLAPDSAFTALLSRLLLRTEFFDLRALQKLPDVLDQLGLDLEADALLYALGHTKRLVEVAEALGKDPDVMAQNAYALRADVPLPDYPLLYNQQTVTLHSRILGCRITVESKTTPPCVEVAESILAALESFFATGRLNHAMVREPELTMEVRTSDFATAIVISALEERSGRPHLTIRCRTFDPHDLSVEEQMQLRDAISDITLTVLAQIVIFRDYEHNLESLFRDERVMERAVAFTGTIGPIRNILGAAPKTRLSAWIDDEVQTYPVTRTEPWRPDERRREEVEESEDEEPQLIYEDAPPPEVVNPNLSHHHMEVISLIRERLWQRARWSGVMFMTFPDITYPPVFAPIFTNRQAGKEIFIELRKELGEVDRQEQLRIVIVRGIDSRLPHAYQVGIGINPMAFPARNSQQTTFMSRQHRMEATSPHNLERFLEAHKAADAFFFVPAFAPDGFDGSQSPSIDMELRILLHQVHVREAWEIGPHEMDSALIDESDEPIIPKEVADPPILRLLQRRRTGRR